jgi:hypothetical protein
MPYKQFIMLLLNVFFFFFTQNRHIPPQDRDTKIRSLHSALTDAQADLEEGAQKLVSNEQVIAFLNKEITDARLMPTTPASQYSHLSSLFFCLLLLLVVVVMVVVVVVVFLRQTCVFEDL